MIFGKNKENKDAWVNDLAHLLWIAGGKQGPDPSGRGDKPAKEKKDKDDDKKSKKKPKEEEEEAEEEKGNGKEDEEFDYSSGSDEEEPAVPEAAHGDPLILFDPFPVTGSGSAAPPPGLGSTQGGQPDAFGMQPFDPFGLGYPQQQGDQSQATTGQQPTGYYTTPQGATFIPVQGGMPAGGYFIASPNGGQPTYVPAGGQPGYGVYLSTGGTADPSTSTSNTSPTPSLSSAYTATATTTPLYGEAYGTHAPTSAEKGSDDINKAVRDTSRAVEGLVLTEPAGGPSQQQLLIDTNLDRIAQQEMQEATRAIEAITQMLASRPRKSVSKPPDAELTQDDVSDAILDAAQAIAKSASVLLRAAANAQLERVKNDISLAQQTSKPYRADPVWAEGLISASHRVVATTQALVTTADSTIKGEAAQESLVATAHAVTASTAQLLASQRAKGDITSRVHADLEAAATGITKATAQLVHATQLATPKTGAAPAKEQGKERYSLTEREKEKIERRARVLELEKQAELARKQLEELNKEDYKS